MEINKDSVSRLSSVPDAELREKLIQVAVACGMSRRDAEAKFKDIGAVKAKLSSLSDSDIRTMTALAGKKKADIIRRALNTDG